MLLVAAPMMRRVIFPPSRIIRAGQRSQVAGANLNLPWWWLPVSIPAFSVTMSQLGRESCSGHKAVAPVTIARPGRDEVILTAPASPRLCNSRACARVGRLAEVIVTYGVLTDPGFRMDDRSALWPESWGRSVPMCAGCWADTRQVAVKYRPGLVIRDHTGPAAMLQPPQGQNMTVPGAVPVGQDGAAEDYADRWREAARLRREHPRWIVVWLVQSRQYEAYERLPGARRDSALTASTAGDLADLMSQAEQATHTPERAEDRA